MDEQTPAPRRLTGISVVVLLLVLAIAVPVWELFHYESIRETCIPAGTCTSYAWTSTTAFGIAILAGCAAAFEMIRAYHRGRLRRPRHAIRLATAAGVAAVALGIVAFGGLAIGDAPADCAPALGGACAGREVERLLFGAAGVGLCSWGFAMLVLAAFLRRRDRRAATG